jgi:hypothetical protein
MLKTRVIGSATILLVVLALSASSASAVPPAPGWTVSSFATPTNFSAGDNALCEQTTQGASGEAKCDEYQILATNAGSVQTNGGAIRLTDKLPVGVSVRRIALRWSGFGRYLKGTLINIGGEMDNGNGEIDLNQLYDLCESTPSPSGTIVQCTFPGAMASAFEEGLGVPSVAPDETLQMATSVTVNDPSAVEAVTNTATVSGGGAREATASEQNQLGAPAPGFGVSGFDFYIDGLDGARDTQAGDHPYELTTTIGLNNEIREAPDTSGKVATSIQDVKDIVVDLPLGFVGSTLSAPECTFAQLSSGTPGESNCPPDTVVGHIFTEPTDLTSVNSPIYNMVPERGVPAEFAYIDALASPHVFYVHVVPTPRGYVLQTTNPDIPQISLKHIVVTFYGDPALRDGSGNAQVPYFTNPTGCESGPLVATIHMDSWQDPGSYNVDGTPNFNGPAWVSSGEKGRSESPAVTGCNALQFSPELGAQPTTHTADTPSGMEFELKLAQNEETGTLATPVLKRAVVKLPEGFTVDPSAGDGLAARKRRRSARLNCRRRYCRAC